MDTCPERLGKRSEKSMSRITTSAEQISQMLLAGSDVLRQTAVTLQAPILQVSQRMAQAIRVGNKVLICGNGGSAADSQHFAAELVGRYRQERNAWPAVALTVDTSILTSVGNDYGFD